MSTIEHKTLYQGMIISCGDGAQVGSVVKYVEEKYGRVKMDLLTMPGGTRAFSGHEEDGHRLSEKNRERLRKMREAAYISLAIYLNHGGDEIHIFDHWGCGFWFDYNDPYEARAAQICSMWMTVRLIQGFIQKLREDRQFAEECVVSPENIKVKKFVLHYASLDEEGNLTTIDQVGELVLEK